MLEALAEQGPLTEEQEAELAEIRPKAQQWREQKERDAERHRAVNAAANRVAELEALKERGPLSEEQEAELAELRPKAQQWRKQKERDANRSRAGKAAADRVAGPDEVSGQAGADQDDLDVGAAAVWPGAGDAVGFGVWGVAGPVVGGELVGDWYRFLRGVNQANFGSGDERYQVNCQEAVVALHNSVGFGRQFVAGPAGVDRDPAGLEAAFGVKARWVGGVAGVEQYVRSGPVGVGVPVIYQRATAGVFESVFSGVGTMSGLAWRGKLHPEGPSPYLDVTSRREGGSDDGGGFDGEKAPLLGTGSGSQTGNTPGYLSCECFSSGQSWCGWFWCVGGPVAGCTGVPDTGFGGGEVIDGYPAWFWYVLGCRVTGDCHSRV